MYYPIVNFTIKRKCGSGTLTNKPIESWKTSSVTISSEMLCNSNIKAMTCHQQSVWKCWKDEVIRLWLLFIVFDDNNVDSIIACGSRRELCLPTTEQLVCVSLPFISWLGVEEEVCMNGRRQVDANAIISLSLDCFCVSSSL